MFRQQFVTVRKNKKRRATTMIKVINDNFNKFAVLKRRFIKSELDNFGNNWTEEPPRRNTAFVIPFGDTCCLK